MSDDAQPGEGQGAAPYQQYLDQIPEEFREQVEPAFKQWDASVTQRFQEASEFRKQWEPFEQIGLHNRDPQAVQWGLSVYDNLNNPQAIKAWYEEYAQANGLADPTPQEPQQQFGEDLYVDPVAQQTQQALSQIQEQMSQLNQWRQQQEEQSRLAQAQQLIDQQVAAIEAEHPGEFDRERVAPFIDKYINTDPQNAVSRGFSDYQAMIAWAQQQYAQQKANQPNAALSGGTASVAPEPVKTLKEAERLAFEALSAGLRT
jgi:predicted enzyme related to lactoylglutathione lyase